MRFRHKEPDYETMKYRVYHDRKGEVFAEVRMDGETFVLRYSTSHAKRLDVFLGGRKVVTCRPGLVFAEIQKVFA